VSGAALWLLSTYVFRGSVPDGVASMVYIAVPGLLALAAAYLAPHQVRPGDTPAAAAASGATVVLSEVQMDAIRAALDSGRMEQSAAGERKVTPTL
jgi:hypothetical protein